MKNLNMPLVAILFTISAIGQPSGSESSFRKKLSLQAISLTRTKVVYNPAYVSMPYPMGDVPPNTGVCTDVVIRAYRKLGIDLQKEVHLDMEKNFDAYPKIWGRTTTDKNIDHRRVPNLMKYFSRKGKILALSNNPAHYHPGEIVCWEISNGVTHIGLLIEQKSKDGKRNLVVHNIGNGQVIEDCLFDFKIIGHYYFNPNLQ